MIDKTPTSASSCLSSSWSSSCIMHHIECSSYYIIAPFNTLQQMSCLSSSSLNSLSLSMQVRESMQSIGFKQLNKLINFTVSVISCMFFIFYKLWAQVYLSNVLLHDHHHACLSFILLVLTYQQVSPLFYRSTKFSVKNTKFWPRMLEFSLGCHLGC